MRDPRARYMSLLKATWCKKYILFPFYYISFPKTFFVALMYMYRTYSHEHGGKRIFPNALVSFWNRMPIVFIF